MIVVAMTAAMLGCDDPPLCTEVVAVGTYARWAAVIRRDGSVWSWAPGIYPTAPATMALERAGATGFSNTGMCLKLPTGDVTCPLLDFLEINRGMLGDPVQELSHWEGLGADTSPAMCAVLWDGTLTCNAIQGVDGFAPIAEGIRHASLGSSLCAITDQGKLSIPWQLSSQADWSVAAASLTDVVEAVALSNVGLSGCIARTAAGQIWWIHAIYRSDLDVVPVPIEVVSERVAGIDGPVSQLVIGRDFSGDFVCALVSDGTVSCWNVGGSGGLIVPSESPNPSVPVKLPGLPGAATGLAGGTGYVCASLQDGTVWCRGLGLNGGARIRC